MSDLLIRGMEIPTGCGAWHLTVWPDGQVEIITADGEWKTSEAVSVPPHGRLGDLDRLTEEVKDMAKEFPPDSIGAERYRLFAEFIKTATTVIPAEEGET